MVTRGGRGSPRYSVDAKAGFPGCPRPGWPLMSEGWGKVTTSSWWLEQAGVGQKASAVVGAQREEAADDGRQSA